MLAQQHRPQPGRLRVPAPTHPPEQARLHPGCYIVETPRSNRHRAYAPGPWNPATPQRAPAGQGSEKQAAMTDIQAKPLTPEQVHRYSRHIVIPQVGSAGQRKLLGARVLIVGAGGLGSPISIYLTLAGVGTIGIVEFDDVDRSNLQRQLLHQDRDIGRPKIESAKETLLAYNPDVNVEAHTERLTSANAMEIVAKYDIVVNGADNFPTRYLINDAAYLAGKPLVDGAILMFDGQAATYIPGHGCYRCLFPTPPPPEEAPSCADAGVIGALPGLVGTIQALETIKLIVGIGKTLNGRLLLIDALDMDFRTVNLRRNPSCPLCGDNPTVTELIDYEAFCSVA